MISNAFKDTLTEELRSRIAAELLWVRETDEAEASLSTLSLQSTLHPHRHSWIDTDMDGIAIDLEDRLLDDAWDDAVARVKVASIADAVDVIGVWLSGATLSEWFADVNQEYRPVRAIRPIHFRSTAKEPVFS